MSVGTTVDTSSNISITAELSKEEKRKRDRDQILGLLLFFGMYITFILVLL